MTEVTVGMLPVARRGSAQDGTQKAKLTLALLVVRRSSLRLNGGEARAKRRECAQRPSNYRTYDSLAIESESEALRYSRNATKMKERGKQRIPPKNKSLSYR